MFVEVARSLKLHAYHFQGLDEAKEYMNSLQFSAADALKDAPTGKQADLPVNSAVSEEEIANVAKEARNAVVCFNKLKHSAQGTSEDGKNRIYKKKLIFQKKLSFLQLRKPSA